MKAPATPPELAARGLWVRAAAGARTSAAAAAAAAERLGTELRQRIGRWVGEDGYRLVLNRAVGLVSSEHPAVTTVASFHTAPNGPPVPPAATPSAAAMERGVIALVTTVIELLGRVIGEEMALTLIAQAPADAAVESEPAKERGAHG